LIENTELHGRKTPCRKSREYFSGVNSRAEGRVQNKEGEKEGWQGIGLPALVQM